MNLKDIRDSLQDYLHGGWLKDHTRIERLSQLIDALERKEANLEKRLDAERDPLNRRHLKIELKVTRMQLAKGSKRRRELQSETAPDFAPPHTSRVAGVTD